MSIFDSIKRLFGEGVIRIEGTLTDGTSFVAKQPYIGDRSEMTDKEIILDVANRIYVESGRIVLNAKIVGEYST